MAKVSFRIEGNYFNEKCFPGLNDLLRSAEKFPKDYNDMKRKYERIAMNSIRRDLKGWKAKTLISLDITWGEPKHGQLRDQDNVIGAGRKIINDALVKTNTVIDDNPRYLRYGRNRFIYSNKSFIEVEIREVQNDTERADS